MSAPKLPRGASGEPPRYFDDPAVGQVLSIVMALSGEVAVLRDRLDTVERLLDSGDPVTRAAIESYSPDERVRAERDEWRQQFLQIVLRVVHEERERAARATPSAYGDVVKEVEER